MIECYFILYQEYKNQKQEKEMNTKKLDVKELVGKLDLVNPIQRLQDVIEYLEFLLEEFEGGYLEQAYEDLENWLDDSTNEADEEELKLKGQELINSIREETDKVFYFHYCNSDAEVNECRKELSNLLKEIFYWDLIQEINNKLN